jgi:beta-lactamase regulating signal transducer with metallopeptidase domain
MNEPGAIVAACLARGWVLLLAYTAATVVVGVLRRPCRRWFGAEAACRLWLLLPLAMLASQWPHAVTQAGHLPPLVYAITTAGGSLSTRAGGAPAVDPRAWWLLLWLAGATTVAAVTIVAQWRYRRRLAGAAPMPGTASRWPVWRAATTDVGPALVGAWRARIVLPADFERRYDATERTLVLAHENAHARRGDGWWCLCAQMLVTMLWFHPLAWLALRALRRDQELACDAAVLRRHGKCRRSYANALLKTSPAALALPVGCAWSPRHPLAERIAMLKQPSPSLSRRIAGMAAGSAVALAVAGSVYAASAPLRAHPAATATGREYQLDMKIELATDRDGHRHAEQASLALCMAPGQAASASLPDWKVEATTTPAGAGQVRIELAVADHGNTPLARSQLQGAVGEPLHVTGKGVDGRHTYVLYVTPHDGCPARTLAGERHVTEHLNNVPARQAAETLAKEAGLVLVNPQALSMAPVTFDFEDMPGERALHLLAKVAGMKAVIDGRQVRFEQE